MRRSSGARTSLSTAGPLRVRNEPNTHHSLAPAGNKRRSRSSSGSRASYGRDRVRSRSLVGSSAPGTSGRHQNPNNIAKFPLANYGTATQNRRPSSGIGIRGRTDIPTDPRPVKDRAYQAKSIRLLCQFLSENNYPHPISAKILQSPPSKDFFRIFEFLFRFYKASYKVGDKPEEEVPRLMKILGYPFSISRSSMYAVGSPHTWPYLLAALIWLVESIQNKERLREDPTVRDGNLFPHKEDDFDSVSEDKILFYYVEKTYKAFLSGQDYFDEQDEELSRSLKEKYTGAQSIDDLTRENARLRQELEDIDREVEEQKQLEEQRDSMERDAAKFEKFLQELASHQRFLDKQLADVGLECQTLEGEKEKISAEIRQMEILHRNQEFTPADVERIRERGRELQRQVEVLEGESRQLDSDTGREEITIAKLSSKLETKCAEYNRLCQTLKLIPATAELANGLDLELKATTMDQMTSDRIIKPHLMTVLRQCKEALEQREQHNQQQSWNLEQKQEYMAELEDENKLLQRDINRVEEELKFIRETFRREEKQQQELVETMERDLQELQKSEQLQQQSAEAELLDLRKRCEQRKKEFKEKERLLAEFLMDVMKEAITDKEKIQKRLQILLTESRQVLEVVRADTRRISKVLDKYRK